MPKASASCLSQDYSDLFAVSAEPLSLDEHLESESVGLSYADGNPICLNDPFGLCAKSGGSWGPAKITAAYTFNSLLSPVQDFVQSSSDELGWMWNDVAGGAF